jgi:hypothetical protein
MKFETSMSFTNSSGRPVIFHLEPWGEPIEMPSDATFSVRAEADQVGSFEVEHLEGEIIVWAWPTAVVKILKGNEEIGISAGIRRPPVPAVPEAQTVSLFLKAMLGKDVS